MSSQAITVRGPVEVTELGHIQPHEHLFCDLSQIPNRWDFPCLEDAEQMTLEVRAYKDAGGGTLVDVTSIACGRSPEKLRLVAEATDVHVVMGTSWYRQPYYPDDVHQRTTSGLAGQLIEEIQYGVADTGIRPGIIGEIGLDKRWMQGAEERVFRASARAHVETGLAITIHTPPRTVETILEILQEENVDLTRVVFGHVDNTLEYDYLTYILRAGCFAEFDLIGITSLNSDQRRAAMVARLVRDGYGQQLLLSQDLYTRDRLATNGGHGYAHLIENFMPMLLAEGLSHADLEHLTQTNPQRVLGVA